jgi:hypothetical protein
LEVDGSSQFTAKGFAMKKQTRPVKLTKEVGEKLAELRQQVAVRQCGRILWDRVLSRRQREQLGETLESAFGRLGTLGMWRQIYGGEPLPALIALGRELDLLSARDAKWLLREIGADANSAASPLPVPYFDFENRQLSLDGKLLHKFRPQARNCVAVLEAFQQAGWPPKILDPLSMPPDPEKIHATNKTLNANQKKLRFFMDGDAQHICWARAK